MLAPPVIIPFPSFPLRLPPLSPPAPLTPPPPPPPHQHRLPSDPPNPDPRLFSQADTSIIYAHVPVRSDLKDIERTLIIHFNVFYTNQETLNNNT